MERIKAINIPPAYIAFAKDVALLAKKNDIDRCQVKITPSWSDENNGTRFMSDVIINFSSIDNRGRPYFDLNILLNASTNIKISDSE